VLVVLDSSVAAMVLPIQPDIFKGVGLTIALTAFLVQISNALFRLTQLFSAPYLGYLADKIGRKPVFLLATIGSFFSYLILIPLNAPAMFANRLFDGASNGFYTAVRSAITDISHGKKELERNLGMLSSLAALGLILGPAIAASLGFWNLEFLPQNNLRLILAALTIILINIALASAFTETLPEHIGKPMKFRGQMPTEHGAEIITEKFRYKDLLPRFKRIWREDRDLGYLMVMEFLMVACLSYYFYFVSYVELKLGMTIFDVAIFMIYFGVVLGSVHFVFFKYINHLLNKRLVLIATSSIGTVSLIAYSFVDSRFWLYALVPLDIISASLIDSVIHAVIGKRLPEAERGSLNGLMQGFSGVIAFVAPLIVGLIALGTGNISAPFYFFAACIFGVSLFAWRLGEV
jgi:MFS transporter, DHA1 family, tetracycline resistance protein